MKTQTILLLISICLILQSLTLGYQSSNVLSNGGFEKGNLTESANNFMGTYPWFTSNSGGNAITVTHEQSHSGSFCLLWNPIGWNVKEDKTIEDAGTFIVTNVTEHTSQGASSASLTGYVNTSSLKPAFRIQIILANDSFTRFNTDIVLDGGLPGWQRFDVSLPLAESDRGMFIAFMAQGTKGIGAPGSKVYIDDLALSYAGPDKKETEINTPQQPVNITALKNNQTETQSAGQHEIPIGLNQIPKYQDDSSIRMANELGLNFIVGITQWLEPTPGQYVWSDTYNDPLLAHLQELKTHGYKVSMTFTNVHMDRKHLPDYLKGKRFNDPYLLQRWHKYLEAFLGRYGDYIDYLNIGNEVNNYFSQHKNEWNDYLEFFLSGRKVIRRLKPNISIGVVLMEQRRDDYWKQLEPYCDHMAITYYTPCSAFEKSPTAQALNENNRKYFARTLNEAIRLAAPKKILITEIGCATHPDIDSSPQLQAQFIKALFGWLEGKEDNILALSWLAPTDWPYEHTKKALQGYLSSDALQHEPFMKYLTSLGLKYEDGTKKPGYDVFKDEIARYRNTGDQPNK